LHVTTLKESKADSGNLTQKGKLTDSKYGTVLDRTQKHGYCPQIPIP